MNTNGMLERTPYSDQLTSGNKGSEQGAHNPTQRCGVVVKQQAHDTLFTWSKKDEAWGTVDPVSVKQPLRVHKVYRCTFLPAQLKLMTT